MDNSRFELNKNLAQMLKGDVIMDVTAVRNAYGRQHCELPLSRHAR